jgi:hypothetical protein
MGQVEDLLFERGIDVCHETVQFWWNGPRQSPSRVAWLTKTRGTARDCRSASRVYFGPGQADEGSDDLLRMPHRKHYLDSELLAPSGLEP